MEENANLLLGLHVPDQGKEHICANDDCNNEVLRHRSMWCKDCKAERSKHFKRQYYIDQGWSTSKLDEEA